ncbi:hypothetical protein L842_6190 [Mycobacterium intracellulare MIN_052511_1280]|nr:hypothetical protein L842_6190 [Mycobacterium intracellulare MIN_052511_1280]
MTKPPPVTDAKPVAPPSVPAFQATSMRPARLKLAAVRRTAPEVWITARTNAGP